MTMNLKNDEFSAPFALSGWIVVGALLLALSAALTIASPLFGYAYDVPDMPVFWLAGGMGLAGLLCLTLTKLIRASDGLSTDAARHLLWAMLAAGLAMRLVLFASEPALEDDYQRYLWDGAVAAHGLNPYAASPEAAKAAMPEISTLGRLALESNSTLERVNHPHLRTIYPPVTQGVFALSHWLAPWSLTGWRTVILIFDVATIAVLLLLLHDLGRSPLWAALYWWNPIVLKELFNAAHMEAIVLPLVLGGLALAIRKRPVAATVSLTMAAGAKIWPLILLPLVWRQVLDAPRKLAAAITLTAAACAVFAWPILSAGIDPTSGFVAYAAKWKTNSALFPLIEQMSGPFLARSLVVAGLALILGWQCRNPASDAKDILRKALIVVAALFLLSPAQFPWYYLWVLPLLCLFPVPGLLALTATLPLYYTAFYFLPRGTYETFSQGIVWLIWLPVWGLLLWGARDAIASYVSPRLRSPA